MVSHTQFVNVAEIRAPGPASQEDKSHQEKDDQAPGMLKELNTLMLSSSCTPMQLVNMVHVKLLGNL